MSRYVFSDLHGNLELFNLIMKFFDEREQAGEKVEYYFLGDACDRMPHGYEIMKRLLADKRCIYLKGNHEDMFFKAAEALHGCCKYDCFDLTKHSNEEWAEYIHSLSYRDENIDLYLNNGGYYTLRDWAKDGMPRNILLQIATLPAFVELENYVLMHAGCNEFEYEYKDNSAMIWDRDHFFDDWNVRGTTLIHGHTPVSYLPASIRHDLHHTTWSPVVYANNTKICMDTACFHTNRIFVLNLDTKEFIPFVGEIAMEETL